jgi:hypothetical protein
MMEWPLDIDPRLWEDIYDQCDMTRLRLPSDSMFYFPELGHNTDK